MKLVASLIVRNEADRYLEPCLDHLAEFCDEVVVLDDGSDDGTPEIAASAGVNLLRSEAPEFDAHEGRARQTLLAYTLAQEPTHILAIDADEFIDDGLKLREQIEHSQRLVGVWHLRMEEIWELDGDCLCIREDRLWRSHNQPIVWRALEGVKWQIADKALASGRVPPAAWQARSRHLNNRSVLHFGWANESTRQARYDRYMRIDCGRFHRDDHLRSIMLPPEQIMLRGRPWPAALEAHRESISAAAGCKPPDVVVS